VIETTSPLPPPAQTNADWLKEQREHIQKRLMALEILESRFRTFGLLNQPAEYLQVWSIEQNELANVPLAQKA
jgi:hypothetical protein